MARIMFDAAIRWAPYAASASDNPSGTATRSWKISCERAALSFTAPPASAVGFR